MYFYHFITILDYMKIIALDIGDAWTGIAISDSIGLLAQPHSTAPTMQLRKILQDIIKQHDIKTIVVGYPQTMSGKESEQTKKIVSFKESLAQEMPSIAWILWDERLSSKRAAQMKKTKTKEDKIRSHAVAACFILDSYLTYANMMKNV
jgi:putative Holliday junction resolvase